MGMAVLALLFVGEAGKYGLTISCVLFEGEVDGSGIFVGTDFGSEGEAEASRLIAPSVFAPARGEARPPRTCCHFRPLGADAGTTLSECLLLPPEGVPTARWLVVVAVTGTGAAGVKDNLFKSGNSSDFLLRGEPPRPEGDVGLDDWGEIWVGREGIGRRRFG